MSAENPGTSLPQPAVQRSSLIDIAVIVALVAIVALGYHFSPLLLPKSDLSATPNAGCDLHRGACVASLPGGGQLEFSIAPRPIPFLKPLQLSAKLSGVKARKVEVDFSGVGMNMGYNRVELAADASGTMTGEASLAVCITDSMAWVATVLVETDRAKIAIPFRFEIGRHEAAGS